MVKKRVKDGYYFLNNDFEDYNDLVKEYIGKLYFNSLNFYANQYQGSNQTNTRILDLDQIEISLGYVEDYLFYFYKFNNQEFFNIFKNLIEKLKFITVLPPQKRGLYGQYVEKEKGLYINPQMTSNTHLDSDSRIRLYINHELGHIINSNWMNSVVEYLNQNSVPKNINKQLIYDGFSLFDESTTQNRAEDITYYFLKQKRPSKWQEKTRLFDNQPYITNYDYYGAMQMPTIKFARILRGIGKINDNDIVLSEFCKKALNKNFANDMIEEFRIDGQLDNFYILLESLGIIKNASYASFGLGEQKYITESSGALKKINDFSEQLRDYREPLNTRQI